MSQRNYIVEVNINLQSLMLRFTTDDLNNLVVKQQAYNLEREDKELFSIDLHHRTFRVSREAKGKVFYSREPRMYIPDDLLSGYIKDGGVFKTQDIFILIKFMSPGEESAFRLEETTDTSIISFMSDPPNIEIKPPTDEEFEKMARKFWTDKEEKYQYSEFMRWQHHHSLDEDTEERFQKISKTVQTEVYFGMRSDRKRWRESGEDYGTDPDTMEIVLMGSIANQNESTNQLIFRAAKLFEIYAGYGVLFDELAELFESKQKLETQIEALVIQLNVEISKQAEYIGWLKRKFRLEMVEINYKGKQVKVFVMLGDRRSGLKD